MKKLTKKDKKEVIQKLKNQGWKGSFDDKSLLQLAQEILNKQLCLK